MCANEVQEQDGLLKSTKNSQDSFIKYFKLLLKLVNMKETDLNNCSPSIVSSVGKRGMNLYPAQLVYLLHLFSGSDLS